MERAKKEGRSDDNQKAIEKRIFVYETETVPVIDHLEKMGKLIRIDANQPVEKIFQDTMQALKSLDMLQ
jgi:UMP-CMP kinase